MGRTIASFNQLVRRIQEEEWGKFRRALRREDREALDALFEMSRYHAGPAAYAGLPDPMEPIFMGMLLELVKRIDALEGRLGTPDGPVHDP